MKEIFEIRFGDYDCIHCCMHYDTKVKLKEHVVEHFTEVYYCKECVKLVMAIDERHVKCHIDAHSKQLHCCVFCRLLFAKQFDLYIHILYDHRVRNKTQCEICGRSLANKQSFTGHVRRMHRDLIAIGENVEIYCNVHSSEHTVSNCHSNDTACPADVSQQHDGEAEVEFPCSEPDMNVLLQESLEEQNSSDSKLNISELNSGEEAKITASPILKHETSDNISFNSLISDTSSKCNTDFGNLFALAPSEFRINASPTDSMGSTFTHPPTHHDTVGLDVQQEHSNTEIIPDVSHTYFELSCESEKIYTCNVCHIQCNNEIEFLEAHFSTYGCVTVKKYEEII